MDGTDLHRSLQHCDFRDFAGAELGYSWLSAPPYHLVDASILVQRWGDDPIREHIPHVLLGDGEPKLIRTSVDDVVSARMRLRHAQTEGRPDPQLHHRLVPKLREFSSRFPAFEVVEARLRARYVPMGIKQSDCGLEEVNSGGSVGRSGGTLWREVIAPAFAIEL
ncbi:MAG TPA: hypothetical protein VEZ20_03250 [Allosphingosinicella sp.]|nr:hypothetical protein [Allosphingosinicella sp.]